MAQTDPDRRLSFSLSGQKAGQKQNGQILAVSAQLMALASALGSLSSVALSSARVAPVYHPFSSTLRQGDISTLQNRGHLYFALTACRFKTCASDNRGVFWGAHFLWSMQRLYRQKILAIARSNRWGGCSDLISKP